MPLQPVGALVLQGVHAAMEVDFKLHSRNEHDVGVERHGPVGGVQLVAVGLAQQESLEAGEVGHSRYSLSWKSRTIDAVMSHYLHTRGQQRAVFHLNAECGGKSWPLAASPGAGGEEDVVVRVRSVPDNLHMVNMKDTKEKE